MFLWSRLTTLIVCWGTSLPRHICWSYYYDPRCFRESPSNLAMFCVPGVIILATILESIPWCHLVSRYSIPGFWTRDSPYLLHVDSFARSFRILVTFVIVLEVRGLSFSQHHEPSSVEVLLNQKITIRVLLMNSPFYIVNLSVLPFCIDLYVEPSSTYVFRITHAER